MSDNTLEDLVESYERDIKTLDEQLKNAKKQLKSCEAAIDAMNIRAKILVYKDMRNDLISQIDHLKRYYDKDRKHYRRHLHKGMIIK